jgi:putative exporter of polyketide antibiotics
MAGDALVVGVIAVLVIVVLCVLISAGRDVGRAVGLLPKPQQRRTGSRKRKSSSSSPYGS